MLFPFAGLLFSFTSLIVVCVISVPRDLPEFSPEIQVFMLIQVLDAAVNTILIVSLASFFDHIIKIWAFVSTNANHTEKPRRDETDLKIAYTGLTEVAELLKVLLELDIEITRKSLAPFEGKQACNAAQALGSSKDENCPTTVC